MKKKVGIIASACASCAVCASMIVGATYALFTSNDKVDISVTSGRVSVSASVDVVSTTSMGVKQDAGKWENGGSASVEGATVRLDKITPGDEVELKVSVANNSNIDTKYRVTYEVKKGHLLASGLDVALNGVNLADEEGAYKTYATAWANLDENGDNVSATIALSADKGNLYSGLSTEISIGVEAVQANGIKGNGNPEYTYLPDYSDVKAEDVVVLDKGANLENALKTDSEGKYIVLSEDSTLNNAVRGLSNVTLDAGGSVITMNEGGLSHLTGTNVTVKNAIFCKGDKAPWGLYNAGVSFYNCVFEGFSPYIDSDMDITFDGCTFNNTTLQFCANEGNNLLPNNLIITNNVFNVNNTDANVHAIVFGGGELEQWEGTAETLKNIVIEGNTFNPVYKDSTYVAYYIYVNGTLSKVRTFFNNTFNGLAKYSVNAIGNQFALTTANITVGLTDAESAKSFLCPDCANGVEAPHSEHSIHSQLTIDENGVATVNKEGAWIAVSDTDLNANKYSFSYTVDVSDMTEGDVIVFDFGEDKGWFGLISGVQKTADGCKAGGCSSSGVLSANAVDAGDVIDVTYVAYANETGFVLEFYVNGNLVVSKTTANAYGNLYWDIYACKYSEGANGAKISNM